VANLKKCDSCGYVAERVFFPDLAQDYKQNTASKMIELQPHKADEPFEFEIKYQMYGTDLCLACTDLAFKKLAQHFRERWTEEQAIAAARPTG